MTYLDCLEHLVLYTPHMQSTMRKRLPRSWSMGKFLPIVNSIVCPSWGHHFSSNPLVRGVVFADFRAVRWPEGLLT